MSDDDLFQVDDPFDDSLWQAAKAPKRRRQTDQHLGCPLEWVKRVILIVRSKEQLAVAIWLHRRRAVCKRELFDVPSDKLHEELGISRSVKHRVLRHLEKAGVIAVVRDNRHALRVRILR
jgi:hypothetical protein